MGVGSQRHAPSDLLASNRLVTHSAGGSVAPPISVCADGQNIAPTGIRPPDRLTVERELSFKIFIHAYFKLMSFIQLSALVGK